MSPRPAPAIAPAVALAIALSIAPGLAACGTSETRPLPIRVTVPDGCTAWGLSLAELPIQCPGQFRIVLRDADDALLQERCPAVDPGLSPKTLADVPALLGELNPQFETIPEGARIRFDIDYYSLGVVCNGSDDINPDDPGTLLRPSLQGRSDLVTVSDGAEVDVAMACGAEAPFCPEDPPTQVQTLTATVQHLDTLALLQQSFADGGASVYTGFPGPIDMETFQFFANGLLSYGGSGLWSGQSLDPIFFPDCVGSMVAVGTGLPVASCDGAPDQVDPLRYNLSAYYLEEPRIRDLAAAAGVTTLSDGMILGRVVDGARNPLAGATVSTPDGSVLSVKYLDDAATALAPTPQTSASGWFIVDSTALAPGAPRCCFFLEAEHDGSIATRPTPIGLVAGSVTSTVIEIP